MATPILRRYSSGGESLTGQGHANEDRLVAEPEVPFWLVVDGHGGASAAEYIAQNLPLALQQAKVLTSRNVDAALAAVVALDREFLAQAEAVNDDSGACLVASFLYEDVLTTIWCGDCRAIFYDASSRETRLLTRDHTAQSNTEEQARLFDACVPIQNGRVCGVLEPSRAVGDFKLKRAFPLGVISSCESTSVIVSPRAAGKENSLQSATDILVLGTDGVWDGLTSGRAIDIVQDCIAETGDVSHDTARRAAKELARQARMDSDDDCTALVVLLYDGDASSGISQK